MIDPSEQADTLSYRQQVKKAEAPKRALARVFKSQLGAGEFVGPRERSKAHEVRFSGFMYAALIYKYHPEFFQLYADTLVIMTEEQQQSVAKLFIETFAFYLEQERA